MPFFGLRFDFRNPAFAGTSMHERYAAAIDMAEWADDLGFVVIVLSEHHGSPDGYLPSPLPMVAAMAARTKNIRFRVGAMQAPLHDPLRLAEDVAVVDNISGGRLDLVVTNGYVAEEFAMFERSLGERAKRTTEVVQTLKAAHTGEPFEFRGRTVRVTPPTYQQPFQVGLGGSAEPAAKRAARIADSFMPSNADLWEVYRAECIELGKDDPGPYVGGDTSVIHLAEDVEAGWAQIAPHCLHEVNAYGEWMAVAGTAGATGGYESVSDVDALRETGQYRVLTPDQFLVELEAKGPFGFAMFHPMVGGVSPEVAWSSLKLFETEVLPKLQP
jgi:alkanesulfonate monooxygenase SsuD/methylene tetrahydromethanopterin reductase-like flavin-dependent oxidoreductase (luciferase family)